MEKKEKLVILSGFPASGKTTVAEHLTKIMEDVMIVSSDEFRRRNKGRRLWDRMSGMVEALLRQGRIPLIDATNYTKAHRHRFIEVATRTGSRYIIVYLAARLDTLLERNAQREDAIPRGAIYRLSSLFEVPVGDDTLMIDTETTSAEDAAAAIADEIRGLSQGEKNSRTAQLHIR